VKIKIDENLPASVAELLRDRGVDAHTVAEEDLAGAADPDLLDALRDEDRMIFTLDRGFGDIRRYPPGTHPGIVVFRLDDEAPAAVRIAVVQLVEGHDLEDLRGTITVVQRGTLRVRRSDG
jgi:predicted nuclease of predicted toxin-antitoxin system